MCSSTICSPFSDNTSMLSFVGTVSVFIFTNREVSNFQLQTGRACQGTAVGRLRVKNPLRNQIYSTFNKRCFEFIKI